MFLPASRPTPLRRRIGALATSLLATVGLPALLMLLGPTRTEASPPIDKEPPIVEFIEKEPNPAPAGPPAPAAAPSARASRLASPADALATPAPVPSPEATPVEPVPVEATPVEATPGPSAPGAPQLGATDGSGTIPGGGGPEDGRGSGGQGDGPPQVDSVRVIKRVMPRFPEAARSLEVEARCRVEFSIDARGIPTAVSVSECPSVFRPAVELAAWKWRFQPARIDGRKSAARFVLTVRFELR